MVAPRSITFENKDEPFFLQVARGMVPHHRIVTRGGLNPDIDTGADESMRDQGGLWAPLAAATVMTVSSSSASDTAAGTGARTVLVTGLNDAYVEISEVVALNGTTGVNTVNAYFRVHSLVALTPGSGGEAAGTLYLGTGVITAGVPAVVHAQVRITYGSSQIGQYTVPAGHTAYLLDITASAVATTPNQNTLLAIRARPLGGVFVKGGAIVVSGAVVYIDSAGPRLFTEKTDIDVIATTTDTNVIASSFFRYMVIRNDDA